MYYLKSAQIFVPLKYFYGISERCSINGTKLKVKYLIKPASNFMVLDFAEQKVDLEADLLGRTNEIRQGKNVYGDYGYHITEYFITEEEEIINTVTDYTLITKRAAYEPNEVRAMKRLLESLGCYVKLSSVLVYERYGFLKKIEKENEYIIRYEDERQTVCIDTKTFNIEIIRRIGG